MQNMYSYIYILTNYKNSVIYTGSTGRELKERIWQHKEKLVEGFTKRYNVNKLVYYEVCEDLISALNREARIKAGSRADKIKLIEGFNPDWKDLYEILD
jgi:putative endonuclease